MDKQCMLNTAAVDVAKNKIHKMTKEEVQQKQDGELLQMIADAKGHTGTDFSECMSCDFSYTYLTGILSSRGYENGWHKSNDLPSSAPKPVIIQMVKSDDNIIRQSFMLEESVAAKWKTFNKNVPFKTVTLGWALRRFMTDYEAGRIKFDFKI